MSPTPDIERLTREHLEAVGALRVEIEARVPDPGKIARIEKSLDGIEDRIAGLETRARRPGGGRRAEPVSPERKAFATFVKKGSEGLGPEEIKVLSVAEALWGEPFGAERIRRRDHQGRHRVLAHPRSRPRSPNGGEHGGDPAPHRRLLRRLGG